MKKLFLLLAVIGLTVGLASPASSTNDLPPEYDGQKKATICHWANGNVHAISISVHALDKHLVWHAEGGWNPTPGHLQDSFLHFGAENKPEDDATCQPDVPEPAPVLVCLNGFVVTTTADIAAELELEVLTDVTQGDKCDEPEPVPPVIVEKEVIKEVEKVVEVPGPTMVITRTVEVPAPAVATPPTAPVATPTGELPHTGGESLPLAGLGGSLTGLGLFLRKLFKK